MCSILIPASPSTALHLWKISLRPSLLYATWYKTWSCLTHRYYRAKAWSFHPIKELWTRNQRHSPAPTITGSPPSRDLLFQAISPSRDPLQFLCELPSISWIVGLYHSGWTWGLRGALLKFCFSMHVLRADNVAHVGDEEPQTTAPRTGTLDSSAGAVVLRASQAA